MTDQKNAAYFSKHYTADQLQAANELLKTCKEISDATYYHFDHVVTIAELMCKTYTAQTLAEVSKSLKEKNSDLRRITVDGLTYKGYDDYKN